MRFLLALCLFVAVASPAAAETRNFSVSGFEKVRVQGPYRVVVRTGVAPFARAEGSSGAIADIQLDVESRTLVVQPSANKWGASSDRDVVTITIGTHDLDSASLSGPGTLSIDKVKSFDFALGLGGSGTATIASIEADRLKIAMAGTGVANLSGEVKQLDIAMKGLTSVQASNLTAKDATIAFSGAGNVVTKVTGTATVSGSGSGNVAFSGSPACTISAQGSGSVTGCH